MMVSADWAVNKWLDLRFAGQFFGPNAASFFIADFKGRKSLSTIKVVQQTNFEVNHTQKMSDRLSLGMNVSYDSSSFWTSSTFIARYLTRTKLGPGGMTIPREVVTFEVGTLGGKEQALAQPKPHENWTSAQTLGKQLGHIGATYWATVWENYRMVRDIWFCLFLF
jgi:hypothetical protein